MNTTNQPLLLILVDILVEEYYRRADGLVDTTPQEAKMEIQRQHGSHAPELLKKRSQWIKYVKRKNLRQLF